MELDELNEQEKAEYKREELLSALDCRMQEIAKLNAQIACVSENRYYTHYEELIEKNQRRREEMSAKLDRIKGMIPDFDEETYKKYEEYYVTQSEIFSISREIECLRELGASMDARKQHLMQQLEKTEAEIANLRSQIEELTNVRF